MLSSRCSAPASENQKGMGTLLVALVLLLLATLFMVVVSRTSLMEQRISSNEVRSKQAFEAAQAGLDAALLYLKGDPKGADRNSDNIGDNPAAKALNNGATYRFAFCEPQEYYPPANATTGAPDACPRSRTTFPNCAPQPAPACPDTVGARPVCDYLDDADTPKTISTLYASEASYLSTPMIVACGWSDDGLAKRMIVQTVSTVESQVPALTTPLVAKGTINVGGSANVVNYFNNLTIWSGGPVTALGSSGKTFIRNPTAPLPTNSTVPPGKPTSCGTTVDYVCTSWATTIGPDVIDRDPALSSDNLSDADMFESVFGMTLADYAASAQQSVSGSNTSSLNGAMGQTLYTTGTTTLPNGTIGSRDRPVKLVINGDLNLTGGPTVYGTVYVTGNITGSGNLLVYGVLASQRNVSPSGSVDVIYEPMILKRTENTGRPGWMTGSWRDWK